MSVTDYSNNSLRIQLITLPHSKVQLLYIMGVRVNVLTRTVSGWQPLASYTNCPDVGELPDGTIIESWENGLISRYTVL